MLRRVVVPLDGSALSELALTHAEEISKPGAKIILLSVIEVPVDYEYTMMDIPLTVVTARNYDDDDFNNTYRRVQDYLTNKARRLTAKGFDVECLVESGDPATVISDVARSQKANAIVMSTHGRTGFSRWLFGSVTQKVLTQMCCPVLVVPGQIPEKDEEALPARQQIPATS